MSEKNNYKDTLIMPKTDFDMRANLVQKEPLYRQEWLDKQIYQRLLERNKNNTPFILHDGPPYANGNLHVGHALNKILKDIIVRYKTMRGFYSPFVPGWDTHGLPIEHKMLQQAKIDVATLTPLQLREKAADYALEQVAIQMEQFKQMQLLTDFSKYYLTLDKSFVAKQLELFKKMALTNLVYKDLKPVYWSPTSRSALAEAEVEYKDIESPSIYVAFPIVEIENENNKIKIGDKLVIWTTTPWTLIANSGIAISEKFQYAVVLVGKERYIIALDLVEKIAKEFNWNDYQIVETLNAKDFAGVEYLSIINQNIAPVVIGHHVTLESGSGLVHIAPLFGEDDFRIGQKYQLNRIMHVNDDGILNNEAGKFANQFYLKANEQILEELTQSNYLLKSENFVHSYPHDWRTLKPVIFRGTPQWFVSIDKIRSEILSKLEKVETYPEWAKKRLTTMIAERNDWTISRQRTWGVPIIIFYDENNEPVIKEEIFDYVIDMVAKEGTNVWWSKSVDELLPEEYRNKGYTKEKDIMDVWFDSGSTSFAVEIAQNVKAPYDLYLEGTDQYRGWFNSSLINSVAYANVSPYKTIVSHGFVVDSNGNKMSKSKGNTIDPIKVITKSGADILRLWAANSEYTNDVAISDNILNQNSEIYRKLRNTLRFLLGNLNNFNYDPKLKRQGIHAYIKAELENVKKTVLKFYDEYKFIYVIKTLNNYVVDLSSFYLNITKDILYIEKEDSMNRLMTLTNFYEIADFFIKILAPILPTTAEDAYKHFNKVDKLDSVHLETLNFTIEENSDLLVEWEEFFKLRSEINVLIENAIQEGLIKRSNEAKLTLNTNSEFIKSLDLKQLLMVGLVEFSNETKIETFDSIKCNRCWNHYLPIQMVDDICQLCHSVIESLKANGGN